MGLQEDIAKFTTLVQDWASKTSDMYYSEVARDITIKVINAVGVVEDITVPNKKKMEEAFNAWKARVNLKNVDGVLTDVLGADVSVNQFGGLTLEEYNTLYTSLFNSTKVKLVAKKESTQMVGHHTMAVVTEDNRVLAWGYNHYNSMSHGQSHKANCIFEFQQDYSKIGMNIKKLFVSAFHFGILYDDGDLWLRGLQDRGHFGIGNTARQTSFVFSAAKVVDYSSSATGDYDTSPMAAIILEDGSVMTAGGNSQGGLGIGNIINSYKWTKVYNAEEYAGDKAVQAVVTGADHASFHVLTESGKLFVSGRNVNGELGNGSTRQVVTLSKINPDVHDDKIVTISTCPHYNAIEASSTYLLTDTGRVYATGYNSQGQLATGNLTQSTSFKEVKYALNHDIVADPVESIHAAVRGFSMVTVGKTLYTVGANNYGQLGVGSNIHRTKFTAVLTNIKSYFPMVGANDSQYPSFYAITEDNVLYSWGNGEYGQLGRRSDKYITTPTPMPFNRVKDIVDFVGSGFEDKSAIFVKLNDGTLHGCGSNEYNLLRLSEGSGYHAEFIRISLGGN